MTIRELEKVAPIAAREMIIQVFKNIYGYEYVNQILKEVEDMENDDTTPRDAGTESEG